MYMFGCISIMIYNAFVIYRKKSRSKAMKKNTAKLIKTINQQLAANATISSKNRRHLIKRLTHVEELIAFSNALNFIKLEHGKDLYIKYMAILVKRRIFLSLAHAYRKKKNEERAYFAHFVSQHPLVAKSSEGICKKTTDTMVSFTTNSDIYCRVNVLKALCKLGDMQGLVSILQFYSDKQAFIHHKLLAEDLYCFAGDKEILALKLWEQHKLWNDNIVLGIITFITMFSDGFKTAFLSMLQSQSVSADILLAIIRYYKKYNFKPAQPILIEYLNQTESYELAMEAASSLSVYPGSATIHALNAALESENWYVRYNAVSSLVELGAYSDSFYNNAQSRDSNVLQMIDYKLDHANEKYVTESEVIA